MTLPPDNLAPLLQALDAQGYVVLPGVLRAEVVQSLANFLYGEYDRHKELYRERMKVSLDDPAHLAALVGDAGTFSALPSDLKHLVRGELPLEVRLDARLKAIAHEEGLARFLKVLLKADALRMHNPPSIRVSAPGLSVGNVPMHQDFAYNQHVNDFVTAWVPFCAIDEECGGVDVLVGSHRSPPLEHEAQVVWSQAVKAPPPESRYVRRHVLLGPGDVLVFGPRLLHASHANTSRRVRVSIDYRFFSSATPSAKHYYDVDRRVVVPPPSQSGE